MELSSRKLHFKLLKTPTMFSQAHTLMFLGTVLFETASTAAFTPGQGVTDGLVYELPVGAGRRFMQLIHAN